MSSSIFGEAVQSSSTFPTRPPAAASPRQLKLRGLRLSVGKHKHALKIAQLVAQMLGHTRGIVSADDVFEFVDPKSLGNAAGAIFSGPEWEPVGVRQSKRLDRRAGLQRTWRLKG